MAITFLIPSYLRSFTEGRSEVRLAPSARTVAEALAALWAAHPGLRDRVLAEQGEVRQHVNIFVGEENIRDTGGMKTPVPDGVKITIVPAVSGGCSETT